jgi:hypothetical protein
MYPAGFEHNRAEKEVVMKSLVLLVSVFGALGWASAVLADSKSLVACALMDEKEALALVGGPLGEVFKNEEMPTVENGHDHNSVCGFFPKGYKIQEADRPPERGVQLQLHVMETDVAAKAFYESVLTSKQDMVRMSQSPLAGGRITSLKGIGKAAFLLENNIESEPGSSYAVATISFLKGRVMGEVQVWKKAGPAGEIAKKAVRKVAAKLP